MKYHLYASSLIPLDWTFCFFTVKEFKERIRMKQKENEYFFNYVLPNPDEFIEQIDKLLLEAEAAAKEAHWDGIYREEPLIFPIPANDDQAIAAEYGPVGTALFGIIIKQDEDGETFIYSPIELKHLED